MVAQSITTTTSAHYAPLSKSDSHSDPDPELPALTPQQEDAPAQEASIFWMYLLCVANIGISGTWALEFAITTPYFEKGLDAGKFLSYSVWVVGPLSGLIIAPIVGSLSDRCVSKFGRRRPFIVAGIIATVVGMLAFSNAKQLSTLIVNALGKKQWEKWTAIVIAIIAFCILDLAVNTTMWPVRALQGDLVAQHQQQSVQSANQVMGSLGELGANLLVESFEQPVTHIQTLFLYASIFYTATVVTIVYFGKEQPLSPNDPVVTEPPTWNIISYLRDLPTWMWRIGTTYALGFFALFCYMPYASTWVGTIVLQGDPTAPQDSPKSNLFETGITLYGRANLLRALLQIVYAAVYPLILKLLTPAQLLSSTFGLFSILLLIFASSTSKLVAYIIIVTSALPMATQFTLPVAMTVENAPQQTGKYLGVLNCFAVLPQLFDTLYTGFLSQTFGDDLVIRIAGVWGIITCIVAFFFMHI